MRLIEYGEKSCQGMFLTSPHNPVERGEMLRSFYIRR